jgi:hypothetical protein
MSSPAELDHVPGGNIQRVISGTQGFEGLFRDGAVRMVEVEKAQQDVGLEPKMYTETKDDLCYMHGRGPARVFSPILCAKEAA